MSDEVLDNDAEALLTRAETVVNGLLAQYERTICRHVSARRVEPSGPSRVIQHGWTICDDCGEEWSDSRGGYAPYVEPPEISAGYALSSALSSWFLPENERTVAVAAAHERTVAVAAARGTRLKKLNDAEWNAELTSLVFDAVVEAMTKARGTRHTLNSGAYMSAERIRKVVDAALDSTQQDAWDALRQGKRTKERE